MLDLYGGGAHCCWYTQIYRYSPETKHYAALVHVWGNFGYVLADLDHDGALELVTRDDRFSYVFASFADSRWPVQILRYRDGKPTAATTSYRSEIGRDANALWHAALNPKRKAPNQGIVAAWAAQYRPELAKAVLISPSLGFSTFGRYAQMLFMNVVLALPDVATQRFSEG